MVARINPAINTCRRPLDIRLASGNLDDRFHERNEQHAWRQKCSTIVGMNEVGVRTDKIAKVMKISEHVVAEILRRFELDFNVDSAGCSGHKRDALSRLVTDLTTDPPGLCCPKSLSLMENPVVAEDGITYERGSLLAEGKHLHLDHIIKSQIATYKEQTVAAIMSVVPHIPDGEAAKLLKRAENFVRSKLPDSAGRAQLLQLWQLRAKLPAALRDDAVKELLQLLVDGHDTSLAELLGHFEVEVKLKTKCDAVGELLKQIEKGDNKSLAVLLSRFEVEVKLHTKSPEYETQNLELDRQLKLTRDRFEARIWELEQKLKRITQRLEAEKMEILAHF